MSVLLSIQDTFTHSYVFQQFLETLLGSFGWHNGTRSVQLIMFPLQSLLSLFAVCAVTLAGSSCLFKLVKQAKREIQLFK
jgi:hypothetical protein